MPRPRGGPRVPYLGQSGDVWRCNCTVPQRILCGASPLPSDRWDMLPEVVSVQQSAFTLSLALSEPGEVKYAIYYMDAEVDYHGVALQHTLLDPVCPAQMDLADADAMAGLVAAGGGFDVPNAGAMLQVDLEPSCPVPLPDVLAEGYPLPCSVALHGLAPDTEYRLCMLATDLSNNR